MRRYIAVLALAIAALVIPAAASSASTTRPPAAIGCHSEVVTPGIQNTPYVPNIYGHRVTVTLYGTFDWVQVRETDGTVDYYWQTTNILFLLPGQQLSVQWQDSGLHSWLWTIRQCGESHRPSGPQTPNYPPCLFHRFLVV